MFKITICNNKPVQTNNTENVLFYQYKTNKEPIVVLNGMHTSISFTTLDKVKIMFLLSDNQFVRIEEIKE